MRKDRSTKKLRLDTTTLLRTLTRQEALRVVAAGGRDPLPLEGAVVDRLRAIRPSVTTVCP